MQQSLVTHRHDGIDDRSEPDVGRPIDDPAPIADPAPLAMPGEPPADPSHPEVDAPALPPVRWPGDEAPDDQPHPDLAQI
jgi:hypothetical protein